MGYRHSLYILEKVKVDTLTEEQINNVEFRYDLLDNCLNSIEILDLGKYSDEGSALCKRGLKPHGILAKFRNAMFSEGDTQFEFLDPEQLVWLAEQYKERTVKHWGKLLSAKEPLETYSGLITDVGEKCKDYVKDLLYWQKYLLNSDKKCPFVVQTTWKYEYEIFNIIHCYKMIDWDKYYLVIIGG